MLRNHDNKANNLVPEITMQVHRVEDNKNDVKSGSSKGVYNHPGNIYFRSLVNAQKTAYTLPTASSKDKKKIISDIITNIEGLNPPGRFLMVDGITEMSHKEISIKTGQALRVKNKVKEEKQ